MTFVTLQNSVFRIMRDTNKTKYNLPFVKQWLNEAEQKYCALTDFYVQGDTSISTTALVKEYSLPTGFKSVIKVFCDGVPLFPSKYESTILQSPSISTPTNYYIRNDLIGLFPIPNGVYSLNLIYFGIGGTMFADNDTPVIPEEHQQALISYACYMCALEGDDTRLNIFWANWLSAIAEAKVEDLEKAFGEDFPVVGEADQVRLDPINHDVGR